VEVLLQGARDDLLAMREWCALRVRRAIVLDVEERWETPGTLLGEFEIR
jgi:acylphosphatase